MSEYSSDDESPNKVDFNATIVQDRPTRAAEASPQDTSYGGDDFEEEVGDEESTSKPSRVASRIDELAERAEKALQQRKAANLEARRAAAEANKGSHGAAEEASWAGEDFERVVQEAPASDITPPGTSANRGEEKAAEPTAEPTADAAASPVTGKGKHGSQKKLKGSSESSPITKSGSQRQLIERKNSDVSPKQMTRKASQKDARAQSEVTPAAANEAPVQIEKTAEAHPEPTSQAPISPPVAAPQQEAQAAETPATKVFPSHQDDKHANDASERTDANAAAAPHQEEQQEQSNRRNSAPAKEVQPDDGAKEKSLPPPAGQPPRPAKAAAAAAPPPQQQQHPAEHMESSKVGVVRALRANTSTPNSSGANSHKKEPKKEPPPPVKTEAAAAPADTPETSNKARLPAIYEKRIQRVEQHESPVVAAHAKSTHAAGASAPKKESPHRSPQPTPAANTDRGPKAKVKAPLGSLSDEELEQVLRQQIQDQKKVPRFPKKAEGGSGQEPRIADVTSITDTSAAVHFDKGPQDVVRLFCSTNQGSTMSFLVETSAMCVAIANLTPASTVSLVVVGLSSGVGVKRRPMVHFHTHAAEEPPAKMVDVSKAREYNDALQRYFAASNAGKVPKAKSPYA